MMWIDMVVGIGAVGVFVLLVFMGCKTALFPHRGSDQFISVREDIAEDNHDLQLEPWRRH